MESIKESLKKYFGFNEFRPGQEELIQDILSGQDVLGVMPTGSGKSICYQLPGLIFDGISIIISPLISLMKDQVHLLHQDGINAVFINSSMSYEDYHEALTEIANGEHKIIYIAPERLNSNNFLEAISENKINMVAVDEAHCISQWGHDFRPSYLKIKDFVSNLNPRPVLAAFTATATNNVKNDIIKQIELKNPQVVTTGYDRKNLYYEVRKSSNKFDDLMKILENQRGDSGIVYCTTRKTVEQTWKKLIQLGYRASFYHGGLSPKRRNENQERFITDELPIMVATNAFGMGIDKSNVNFVIHYNMPKDLESYYQEAGRAGRDGTPGNCILLYSPQDTIINKFLIEKTTEEETSNPVLQTKLINKKYDLLNKMEAYCMTRACYRKYILDYFGDKSKDSCDNCYNCSGDFETIDITQEASITIQTLKDLRNLNKRFGKTTIVDILKGSNTKNIKKFSLNHLNTFGKLADKSKTEIKNIIDFLITENYIKTIGKKFPVLILGKNYISILNQRKTIEMKVGTRDLDENQLEREPIKVSKTGSQIRDELSRYKQSNKLTSSNTPKTKISNTSSKNNYKNYGQDTNKNRTKSKSKSKSNRQIKSKSISKSKSNSKIKNKTESKTNSKSKSIGNEDLFNELRKIRLDISKEERVPAYIIFHDSTLQDMANKKPQSKSEFLEVSGVGKVKLEKYGDRFINTIKSYLNKG
ncbi:MAG: RecQ family ATP-dependent DNA helicase [Methanobrevibacter sp.]|nr:RecQ family ATP-dependent DNA helicase [Methanobrevibacter sp.]